MLVDGLNVCKHTQMQILTNTVMLSHGIKKVHRFILKTYVCTKFYKGDCTEHDPIHCHIFHMSISAWSFCQKDTYLCTPNQAGLNSASYLPLEQHKINIVRV